MIIVLLVCYTRESTSSHFCRALRIRTLAQYISSTPVEAWVISTPTRVCIVLAHGYFSGAQGALDSSYYSYPDVSCNHVMPYWLDTAKEQWVTAEDIIDICSVQSRPDLIFPSVWSGRRTTVALTCLSAPRQAKIIHSTLFQYVGG